MNSSGHETEDSFDEWTDDYIDPVAVKSPAARESYAAAKDFEVDHAEEGVRLDRVLALRCPELSRSVLQHWITQGHVEIDGASVRKPSISLHRGQRVRLAAPEPEMALAWTPEPMELEIVFEDKDVIVLNKPAGLVVHPAAGHPSGTLVNGLLHHAPELGQLPRAGIVHRLDRDTSGLLAVAKSLIAQVGLVRQLQSRTVKRTYLALAWGAPKACRVVTGFGRDVRDRQKMAALAQGLGKEAITHIEPIGAGLLYGQPVSLVNCQLETGRTHQIRVHLEHLGAPIVGDRTYRRHGPHANRLKEGAREIEALIPGQALHAYRLEFHHPVAEQQLAFLRSPPAGFLELLGRSGIHWAAPKS